MTDLREITTRALFDWDGGGYVDPEAFDAQPDRVKSHYHSGADAVLAAIRGADRLAPEVPGDVEEGAYEASIKAAIAEGFGNSDRRLVRVVLNASAPLIAAAAEAKARQAAAICADQWSVPSNVRLAAGEMTAQELRTAQAVARGIAAAIRTGAAS